MQRGTKTVIVLIVVAVVFAAGTLYVALLLRESPSRRLVLVRVTVDVTTEAPQTTAISADFGPHCAPARFAPSGALVINSDAVPTDATGVVYLEYRPVGAFATSGSGIALLFFRPSTSTADVVSSVDPARVLFTIGRLGSVGIVIDDFLYDIGQSFVETFTTLVTVEQSTWSVQETFTGKNVGPVGVTVEAPGLCV